MKTFLVELQNRPDEITNTSLTHYSTEAVTMATFYQRCAAAITSTQFVTVLLMVIREDGSIVDRRFIKTQYQPPESEEETEPTQE